jgi:hypothetical protein
MSETIRDIAVRAAKTAVQVFFATATVDLVFGGDFAALQQIGLAALAAGASVIWNAVLAWSQSE